MLKLKYVLMLIIIKMLYQYNIDAVVMQALEIDSAVTQPFIRVAIYQSSH